MRDLINALRCSSSVMTDTTPCATCKYSRIDQVTPDDVFYDECPYDWMEGTTKMLRYCDIEKMGLDAADALEAFIGEDDDGR